MPTFTIKDNVTGRTLTVQGDAPPTDAEMEQLFSTKRPAQSSKPDFVPEIVAGSPEQQQMARARNMQGQLGLQEPVNPNATVPMVNRLWAGMAPTPQEQDAYHTMEYGPGGSIRLSQDRSLVRVPDGKGGKQWVVDNPSGFDAGDVAQFMANAPQALTGAVAAMAAVPGPQAAAAKLALASGAGAIAANLTGAVQDAAFRYFNGLPINPGEIAQRRGTSTAVDAALGFAIPAGLGSAAKFAREGQAVKNFIKPYLQEGERAAAALKERFADAGANVPGNSAKLAEAVRSLAGRSNAAEMGDAIAAAVTKQDDAMRQGATRLAGGAIADASKRAEAQILAATAPKATPSDVGVAVQGGAKKFFTDAQKSVADLYSAAYQKIAQDAASLKDPKHFVSLDSTDNVLKDILSTLPRKEGGEVSDAFLPLKTQIEQLGQMTGVTQKLEAMRQTRTMLGERIKGKGGIFGSLDESVAKRLYGAISDDIDRSVSSFSGDGGNLLKQANAAYKAMVQPVEENSLLDKIVNGGFQNPEEVVKSLSTAGTKDWAVLKSTLGPNTYGQLRRAVVEDLIGGSRLQILGRDVADIPTLNKRLAALDPVVKREIFGGDAPWQALQKIGNEYKYIQERGSIFTKPALPTMQEINDAVGVAQAEGLDKANAYISRATRAAAARRNNLGESLVSLARNGNTKFITQDPEGFLNAVVMNDGIRPEYLRSVFNKLDEPTREKMGQAAFQQLFENARNVAEAAIGRRSTNTYNTEEIARRVFGSTQRRDAMKEVLGEDRFFLLKDWLNYEISRGAVNTGGKTLSRDRIANLVATAPYQNLFAARLTSAAIQAAGSGALKAGPDGIKLFAEARRIMLNPKRTAAEVSLLQRALNTNGWNQYERTMQDLSPEQRDAVDSFLIGR